MIHAFSVYELLWAGEMDTSQQQLRVWGPCAENNIHIAIPPLVFTRSDHVTLKGLNEPRMSSELVLSIPTSVTKSSKTQWSLFASPHLATAPLRRRKSVWLWCARAGHCCARCSGTDSVSASALTDVIILDVHDELGQRLEVQSAASELANVGEEGGGGDACHGLYYIEEQQHRVSGKEIAHTHARTVRQTAAAAAAGATQDESARRSRRGRGGPTDTRHTCWYEILHTSPAS